MTAVLPYFIGIVVCIAFSAFFSASEMAYSSCNKVRLENEANAGSRPAGRALKIAEHFEDTIGAILIGNNLVNIAASSMGSVAVILLTGGDEKAWISTVVITILVVIFGETIPKITAKRNANRLAVACAGPITVISTLLKPLVKLTVALVQFLTRNMKEESQEEDEEESVEELHQIIETAEDEGVLAREHTGLIRAAIDFGDISASEAMTARVDVEAIDIDDSMEEIIEFAENTTFSRIPVYEGSIDNIIGILHLNHLLRAVADGGEVDIRSLMLEPLYVYKTLRLPAVLNVLRNAKQHLAIVTDEYSGTLGVITMEDVLEQIVGDIWDETDTVYEEVVIRGKDEMEVDGDMVIADFLELVGIDEEDFECESETVGGWVIETLERFPEVGDSFDYEDLHIEVTAVDGRRVESIFVKREKKL